MKKKLKEGQELVTVKHYKEVKGKASNNTNALSTELMANWLGNDPDPMKTLDNIKKENTKKKALSKNNPVKLMKLEMNDEEYIGFWQDLNNLRKYYAIEFKGKKIKKKDLPQTYYLPQCVFNYNAKYWKNLMDNKRFYEHPEFMVIDPEDLEDKPQTK